MAQELDPLSAYAAVHRGRFVTTAHRYDEADDGLATRSGAATEFPIRIIRIGHALFVDAAAREVDCVDARRKVPESDRAAATPTKTPRSPGR